MKADRASGTGISYSVLQGISADACSIVFRGSIAWCTKVLLILSKRTLHFSARCPVHPRKRVADTNSFWHLRKQTLLIVGKHYQDFVSDRYSTPQTRTIRVLPIGLDESIRKFGEHRAWE